MIRNATLNYAVRFTNACKNANLNPMLTARLIELTIRAFKAGERDANGVGRKGYLDRCRTRVEEAAKEQGLTVEWPGLYPEFSNATGSISIPCPN